MPDAVKAVAQDVDQEARGERRLGKAHDPLTVAALYAAVLPAERHGVGIVADEAMVQGF